MIKKWEVSPAPNDKNPARHKLLIKGEMRDIFLIVKKLGGLCSRPEKTSGDFNFTLYLTKLEMETMIKLKEAMSGLSAGATAQADSGAGPRHAAAPETAPEPFELPKKKLKIERVSAPEPRKPEITSETARAKKEEPACAMAPKEEFKPASAPKPAPAPASKLKPRWSIELPLIPTYSFRTLIAGSHNRFAHAAAMAVVENPGVIYNPLLLFGAPGTGKTHFVHSISHGISSSIGQNNVFVTDGIKLSKGVEIAVNEGTIARLEEMFSKIRALIIDDIHLLVTSLSNKKYISKWLNEFVAQNKQIIVASVFPPKSLSGLEDAVEFQFTQGWMVDLKLPAASSYKLILNQLLQSVDVKLSEEELDNIFARKSMPFGEVVKVLESMKKLEKMAVNAGNSSSHAQLIDMLLGSGEIVPAGALGDYEGAEARSWGQPGSGAWFKWGIFYPKAMEREARFALYKMHERSVELGFRAGWTQVFMEEYNSDETYGIPFKIGNYAAEHGVNGVIVLGPQPSSALGAQEAEFKHITFKILDSYLLKGAWIPYERLKSQAVYTKTLMDLS